MYSVKKKCMFSWDSLAVSVIQQMLAICSPYPLPFVNPFWHLEAIGSLAAEDLETLSIPLLVCEMSAIVGSLNIL